MSAVHSHLVHVIVFIAFLKFFFYKSGFTLSFNSFTFRCFQVDATCTPEPIDEEGKVPFCKDTASFEDKTKQCGGGDECCGALREYFEM